MATVTRSFDNFRHYVVIEREPERTIKIGRSRDCEFRIKDISISSQHAEIFFKGDRFYIKDLGSKNGTLLKMQRDIKLPKIGINIQVGGRHYMIRLSP